MQYPHIDKNYIKNLDELQTKADTWFTQGMAGKFFYMRTWLQNINFHAGNQWLTYDEKKQVFELDPILDDELRLTINKILPAVRMAVGKVLQDRKRPVVIQRNMDEDSITSAKVATQYLEHLRRTNDQLYMEKETLTWSVLGGKGITKKWYDTKTDRIVTDVISPFEFVPPPNVRKMSKFPWACHARFETVEWVFERYGVKVEGSSDWGQYGMFLAAVKNIMEDGNYTGVFTQGMDDNVLVKDWWIRPCQAYPKGALVVQANNDIIYAGPNPYSKGDEFFWPFAELDFFDAPYRYWPISLVENIIDPQKWINEFHSDNIQNLQYANTPTWWAQEGSVVADEVSMKPGSINYHQPGTPPPVPNVTRSIDPAIFTQAQQFEQAIGELSGIHFFGPGSLPPGVHAAAALAIINEQDQIAAMAVSANHEKWLRDCARQDLYLTRAWAPSSMWIRVMGDEGQWEVVEFKRDMVKGDEEIHVESKAELAQDKMTRTDQILKFATTPGDDGKPLIDTEQALRMLGLEKEAGIVTPRLLNRNMAMDENQRMWSGEDVEVYAFEDHKTHMEAHLEAMLTIKFKQAKKDVQERFMQHYRDHEQAMNEGQSDQTETPAAQVGQSQPDVPPEQQPPQPPPHPPMVASGLGANLQQGMSQAMNPTPMG